MKMGSNFKKAIFDEHVQAGILGWREKVKKKKALRGAFSSKAVGRSTEGSSSVNGSAIVGTSSEGATTRIQMANLVQKENEGNEIQPSNT